MNDLSPVTEHFVREQLRTMVTLGEAVRERLTGAEDGQSIDLVDEAIDAIRRRHHWAPPTEPASWLDGRGPFFRR